VRAVPAVLRAEPDEVDDFQDAERIDDQEGNEPLLLAAACGVPERVTLQDNSPQYRHENKRYEDARESRRQRRIERRVCLHMYGSYHTLCYMRYLGIDYGSKKVGLALSDEAGVMGFPHAIWANAPRLVDELCALIAKENIGAVVIGESRTLAGGENAIAKDARALGSLITEHTGTPVFYESEVFTSAEARRAPAKEMKSRAAKSRADVDASAAALILTSYLSRINHGPH